ncbi:bifunctional [glutamine synthetase] adenylyltransferase/[glutamine synthetase]-adenylyl-L-tyrosine phosphorylase [Actinocorallia sp. API 0066]|uniref:bifunctional [glutamine synthetase] adenylyltransferase/[glutamine synthetase]-adenylyl-L-tyrosine phosphorylase n=1 Tax=Actinocorallia sp. API 0066 TaxID=2896846 RepID=UPI001E2BE8DE|nr:bifunctional [glutamine synthetase] adenylyltransferase/[glutamine synthetase]-adenylyl-L-tyrosine phosphorylase [Actinocorallia sp. API 0066]MCD0451029.1 bifunctional [glutamine synthetase] adenylyltransferase/[glutamine synthetase]-adenylyl-L-tyrosine phosphorylase [Actinocorallia sp. API 0066]
MGVSERRTSLAARLARLGFTDASAAQQALAALPVPLDDAVIDALGGTADPDLALSALLRLTEADPSLRDPLRADDAFRARLLAVLGVSAALGDHLVRHPRQWNVLRGEPEAPDPGELRAALLRAVGADPAAALPVAAPGGVDALRVAYRERLVNLAGRDLCGECDVKEVAAELAALADAALEAGLAIARAEVPDHALARLAVIGMGKSGGRELNYVSDVDVIFVAEAVGDDEEAALKAAGKVAAAMIRACSATTPEGALWEVDANLRPEGRSGPLVRTLASHRAYYERWAKTWEFQALLKARPVAGDTDLGAAYLEMTTPLVWRAAQGEDFVADVQAMRRRVEEDLKERHGEVERQLKLGPGGLRDVEFAVQLLQLVHGKADEELHSGNTLDALAALSAGGYVGREDAASLDEAYRFLRRTEHLLQLHHLRRTHLVPAGHAELRRLGRALGLQGDPAEEFTEKWRRHARGVRRIHEKLFYRPLLVAVANLPDEARLTPEAARARLLALGYNDPAGALRHIEALTKGVSRRAAIQRTLLPVMLGWFADAPDPDAGLLGFRRVSDALGSTPWYLRLLRDDVTVAERMARLLASSAYVTDLLLRAPDGVSILGKDGELKPRAVGELRAEAMAVVSRHEDREKAEHAVAAVRAIRRRELFRVSVADLLGIVSVREVSEALTDIASVTIEAALVAAINKIETAKRTPLPCEMAVVAMGRFGGHELGYGSDADVMFVYDPHEGVTDREAHQAAHAVAEELRRLLALPAPEPPLGIDPNLRPEGKSGPLVRSLSSYAAYYGRWSSPWESQALLRADPLIGSERLRAAFADVINPIRWPDGGISDRDVHEIRRLKARMEAERLPRGVDRRLHLKLGPGGLSDVEWVAQLLQLKYASEVPGLRTTRTLDALESAVEYSLLDAPDATVLAEAWELATRIRGAVMLVRGRASDLLPTDHHRERTAVSRMLGYPGTGDMLEDWRKHARHAREVTERVFYGSGR